METDKALELLCQGTQTVAPVEVLKAKLASGRNLIIKLGMDPTAPDLHLGHAVVLNKMRQFQQLGHTCVFLIGDFTARIGDPTGRSKTRPPLTTEQIAINTKTYFDQVKRILDPEKTLIRYNSEWLDKVSINDLIKMLGKVTLARIIEREDFSQRLANQQPIGMHELLYPLMQGYDSVALKADVELGGSDQTFNLCCGRYLQEQYGQEPQVILTTPILEGLDGTMKMSKSLGNYVGLTEPASEAFGKLMSISDELMWRYAHLLLDIPLSTVHAWQHDINQGTLHPMTLKKAQAEAIVARYWSPQEAAAAREQFEALFQQKDYSTAQPKELPADTTMWIVDLLKYLEVVSSSSEARRLITSKAVSLDGTVIDDFAARVELKPDMIVKAGKHKIFKLKA